MPFLITRTAKAQRFLPSLGFAVIIVLFSGCLKQQAVTVQAPPQTPWADSLLATMGLESKVAQMIMVDFPVSGDIESEEDRREVLNHLLDGRAGGVVLFAGNPISYAPWMEWIQGQSPVAQLIALDAEWGPGFRLKNMTRYPNAMAITASGDPQLAYRTGHETARQASSAGISVLFAPVVDVQTNPRNPVIGTRAWSDHPDSVALYAAAFARGVRDAGLLPVAKHFPGHGDTSKDSHTDLPVSNRTEEQFFQTDLKPFMALIADSLEAIMSAHILPLGHSFADTVPSTLSHRILTELARDSLHFNGLLFSDALNMAGVTSYGTSAEVAVRAVEAGIDVLLMPPNPSEVLRSVVEAVRSGRISASRIDSSVRRILQAKERLGLPFKTGYTDLQTALQVVTSPKTAAEGVFVGRKAVTLIKNESLLPLSESDRAILLVTTDFRSYSSSALEPSTRLLNALGSRTGRPISLLRVDPKDAKATMRELSSMLDDAPTVVYADFIGTTPVAGWNRSSFLREWVPGNEVLVLEHASPYAVVSTPNSVRGHIVAYDASRSMIEATADVIFGLAAASGHLPVDVSETYPRGYGISIPQYFASASEPESAFMDEGTLGEMDDLLGDAVFEEAFPAAAVAVGRGNNVVKREDFGRFTYETDRRLQEHDEFDLASLTKVIATTTAIMQLYERGLIDLNRPVSDYLPEFGAAGKGSVTIWDLLTHTGGLVPFVPFYAEGITSARAVRKRILGDSLSYEPGSRSTYSDFGPITLAWMVERLTGEPFDRYTQTHIFQPLSMFETGYRTVRKGKISNAVPTEKDNYFRYRTLQGEVHDETAYVLGGTAGHAGLFSTANDLAKFAAMMANDGQIGDRVFLKPETIRLFTTKVDPYGDHTRALGWDTKSPSGYSSAGSHFGPRSFGHTGFTGTSLWIDPDTDLYVILLTNRVYPTRDNRGHIPIRPAVADIAFSSLKTRTPSGAE